MQSRVLIIFISFDLEWKVKKKVLSAKASFYFFHNCVPAFGANSRKMGGWNPFFPVPAWKESESFCNLKAVY